MITKSSFGKKFIGYHLRLSCVGQEGGEDGADEPRRDEQHHQDGSAEHHQGGAEPLDMK